MFTDDDLKRLKAGLEHPASVEVVGRVELMKALLARLEAAEAVCNTQEHTCNRQIPIICRACINYDAWRRAKGENDSKAAGKELK